VQVAVCGPAECTEAEARAAFTVGRLLAARGVTVLCGGGPGVMAAVAAGARSGNGTVVGILPGIEANPRESPDLTVTVRTGMGQARNVVLIASADAVIAVGGSWGTLSEVAHAMRRGADRAPGSFPVVSLGGWRVVDRDGRPVPGVVEARDPDHAVALVLGEAG
jgi:uncharacterized protein (TIGR00725 family)